MKNILFSGNNNVFDGVVTCMLSIFKRSTSTEPICFYIMTMDVSHLREDFVPISDKQIDFIDKIAKSYNKENCVKKVDVTDIYQKEFAGCPNEGAYCSPYTLLRLFADMALPEVTGKLLYLDVDIMFNRDIDLLYNVDLTGYEYAASTDHYGKFLIRPDYINAGVILFNMDECRKTGLFEKARNQIKSKKWLFADQDALWHSTTKKKILPQKFNDQKFLWKNTVVRHFSKRLFYLPYPHTDNIKQWHVEKMHKVFKYTQFDDCLDEYLKLKADFQKAE